LVEYQKQWTVDYQALATALRKLEVDERGAIEHVGSTAVFGLIAKDVIDVQVRVAHLDVPTISTRFTDAGFRRRPEEWNNHESTRCGVIPKLVFAPPVGARPVNVHIRTDGTQGARDSLLFRDYLRSEAGPRIWWAQCKRSIVESANTIDLASYGQAKQPKWEELMFQADAWAEERNWQPMPIVAWSSI
jgi:GrpB-like predicted nucleotidyltransferase (UPF0157 family)